MIPLPSKVEVNINCSDCCKEVFCCMPIRRRSHKHDIVLYNASENRFEYVKPPILAFRHRGQEELHRLTRQKIAEQFVVVFSSEQCNTPVTREEFDQLKRDSQVMASPVIKRSIV